MRAGRFRISRPDIWIGMAAALGVAAYVISAEILHNAGLPLDDGWIHQTYARNLAQRGEWAFVPGETSVASTSPLWTLLLAVGYVLQIPHLVWTYGLGALALAFAGWSARRLGAAMFPDLKHAGTWSGLAVVTAWHLVWAAASGMETTLFSALGLVMMGLGWRDASTDGLSNHRVDKVIWRGARFGLVGAALTLTRPEGIALVALTASVVLAAQHHRKPDLRLFAAWLGGAVLALLVCTAPYVVWNYHVSGDLLPETASAKQAEYAIYREQWSLPERYGRMLLPLMASGLVLLLPGVVAAILTFGVRRRHHRQVMLFLLPFIWALLLLSAYAVRLPANYQHGRYVMPIVPPLLLYGVGGSLFLLKTGRRRPAARILSRVLALSVLVVTAGFWWLGARQYARDVRIINTELVDTAQWVERRLPADHLLAVHDIGAVGYFAPRPIFDLAGLVSPEVVPVIRDRESLMRLMCERGVRYLMVFPDQRPADVDDPRLGVDWVYDRDLGKNVVQPIFRSQTPYAAEAGGQSMMIYRFNWLPGCK